jgi:hypothetical protein
MSYNGSGTFQINSAGQPVVTGTVISSTAFNALTADLATGLSTAITKDGQTTTTARVPFAAGINSTLTTDATSATTGSIITAGGISCQKQAVVGTNLGVGSAPLSPLANRADVTINGASAGAILTLGNAGTRVGYLLTDGTNVSLASETATGYVRFLTNSTERMQITSAGLVGIGCTPTNTLDVSRTTVGTYFTGNGGDNSARALAFTSSTTTNSGDTHTINAKSGTGIIAFAISSAEAARIDSSGDLLVGTTTNLGQSEFRKSGGDYVLRLTNTNASPYALRLGYSAADPNNATNTFIFADGTGGARFIVYSNGGIANYSANNVNLSDVGVKPSIENIADSADLSAALWEAHKNIDWNRHKYEDQTHDDWNYGYTAQGVRKAFAKVAPELVDFWEEGKSDKLAVYHHDVTNITGAVVTMLQSENEALKASIAELTTRLAALENK